MRVGKESRHRKMKIYAGLSETLFFINPGLMRPDPGAAISSPTRRNLSDGRRPLEPRILIIAVRTTL